MSARDHVVGPEGVISPRVVLVRHGETAWSVTGQHTGRTDLPLTERGEQEAALLEARLRGGHFAKVLTSPLQRARRTSELAGFGAVAVVEPDLAEWSYGQYEGLSTAGIQHARPGWDLFRDGCPGGETLDDVCARAERLIVGIRESAGDVLLFAHRDILRVLAVRWVGLPAAAAQTLQFATASLGIVGYEHGSGRPVIMHWNDDRHFADGEAAAR
jgi:probable phosphoglycerate mutase